MKALNLVNIVRKIRVSFKSNLHAVLCIQIIFRFKTKKFINITIQIKSYFMLIQNEIRNKFNIKKIYIKRSQ